MAIVFDQPLLQVEVIELLAPEYSCQSLAMYPALIFIQGLGSDPVIKFISLGDPFLESRFESVERIAG